ncbi:condensation domain-containing protein [Mycolicibacterium sp.]|uniref:condensation domain-containing protein n=1 Tax=Mycolicibacterium sp. TaxID=2320850 RepID=UPI003D11C789
MVALRSIQDWVGEPGRVVSWQPSPASAAKMRDAPISPVPVSYQQEQHIRTFLRRRAAGADMARLNVPAWDIPGQCDLRAMSHVLNAYLRRHDTYHSRFEIAADGAVVRRTARSPRDLKLVPTDHGEMAAAQWRAHILATPDPLNWDCFSFGIIQRRDHFTFYISVDHVHTDAMFMCLVLVEIHMMYLTLVNGGAPLALQDAGSYDDFCVRQRRYTAGLTPDSPEVRAWIEFAERNDGGLPRFPLPLGDVAGGGDMMVVQLLDARQSRRFDAACTGEGVRFSGGVLACAALTDHEFTGAPVYHGITPTTTRSTPAEFLTTGWFTGLVPVTVPVEPASFGATARAAQSSFDAGIELAQVPFERVMELARALRGPGPGVQMVSYLDAGLPPLSPAIIAEWEKMNGKVFCDSRSADQVGMWVNRTERETVMTVAFPDNPIARDSVQRYVHAMKQIFVAVAEENRGAPIQTALHTTARHHSAPRAAVTPLVGG